MFASLYCRHLLFFFANLSFSIKLFFLRPFSLNLDHELHTNVWWLNMFLISLCSLSHLKFEYNIQGTPHQSNSTTPMMNGQRQLEGAKRLTRLFLFNYVLKYIVSIVNGKPNVSQFAHFGMLAGFLKKKYSRIQHQVNVFSKYTLNVGTPISESWHLPD